MSNISIQVDSIENFQKASGLFVAHWNETELDQDEIKMAVWDEAYLELAAKGVLHLVTVKDGEKIVGYHASTVQPHIHHRNDVMAFTLSYYLDPAYRKSGIGVKMFKFVEKTLAEKGARKMYMATKKSFDLGALFESMGFREDETVYSKMIGA